jgi:hypothetical protein
MKIEISECLMPNKIIIRAMQGKKEIVDEVYPTSNYPHMLIFSAFRLMKLGKTRVSIENFKTYMKMFLTEEQIKQLIGELLLKI